MNGPSDRRLILAELQLKNRHFLRKKEAKQILKELESQLGMDLDKFRNGNIELADTDEFKLIIINNAPMGFYYENKPFLSLRALLALESELGNAMKYITVDKGAVRFVSNGADIMIPGIVEAEPSIEPGDFVWIREETHHKPLAVGIATLTGEDIMAKKAGGEGGKAVRTIHYVGDRIWQIEA